MQLTLADVRDRWTEMSIYTGQPMRARLSGLGIEYAILQVYSRDAWQRSAVIGFNVGQGTQDIGFRNEIEILLTMVTMNESRGVNGTARSRPHLAVTRAPPTVR